MKPVAYILTLLMLFLTVHPILAECQADEQSVPDTSCSASKGCNKKDKSKNTENKDCARSTGCNPFASCSQCQYVAVSKFIYPGSIGEPVTTKIPAAGEDTKSGFISDCWHPPRV